MLSKCGSSQVDSVLKTQLSLRRKGVNVPSVRSACRSSGILPFNAGLRLGLLYHFQGVSSASSSDGQDCLPAKQTSLEQVPKTVSHRTFFSVTWAAGDPPPRPLPSASEIRRGSGCFPAHSSPSQLRELYSSCSKKGGLGPQ